MRLFAIGPYWYWSMRPQKAPPPEEEPRTFPGPQSDDPLDEHHTYLYHLFLKYGLVDEVLIHSDRKMLDEKQGIPKELEFYGKPMRVSYDGEFFDLLRKEKGQILFARQRFNFDTMRYPQHVQLAKSVSHGFPVSNRMRFLPTYVPVACRKRNSHTSAPDFFLAEGPYNARFVRKDTKTLLWPSLSGQSRYVQRRPKRFDWIIVGSFNPRKRVAAFCKALLSDGLGNLSGCILARVPKNDGERGEYEMFRKGLLPKLDIHLAFNTPCREKMEFLAGSRVLVSPAAEDSGPRSVIEAGQAGIPVLAMKHHGSASLLVRPGSNGELTWSFRRIHKILQSMLLDYSRYDCSINKAILSEDRYFSPIARGILDALPRKSGA